MQQKLHLLDLSVPKKVAYENSCEVVVSCSWLTLSSLVVSCDVVVSCSWLVISSYTVERFDTGLVDLTVLRLLVVVVHLALVLIVAVEMVVAAAAVPV